MKKPLPWLRAEIDQWAHEGLVTPEQAQRLRDRYPLPAGRESWGMLIFTGLGAAVIGLGVILLLAYNWSGIPKEGKLGLILGGVAVAHGAGLVWRFQPGWRAQLGEACLLLGTMGFGAGIWLIAQIYHINEHFPTGFLLWGLGALAMAWALGSTGQGLIAVITLTCWGGSEVLAFDAPAAAALLLLIAGVGPLAWRLRSPVLLAALLAGLTFLWPVGVAHWGRAPGAVLTALAWSALLIGLRRFSAGRVRESFERVLGFFGLTGFLVTTFILSFPDAARHLLRIRAEDPVERLPLMVASGVLLTATLAIWGLIGWRGRAARHHLEGWLYPATVVFAYGAVLTGLTASPWIVAGLFNLVLLAVAGAWIVRGCRDGRAGATVLGSLLLGAVVFARYFDLFDSLLARGLAFVVFGAVLFGEGFYYRRQRPLAAVREVQP